MIKAVADFGLDLDSTAATESESEAFPEHFVKTVQISGFLIV